MSMSLRLRKWSLNYSKAGKALYMALKRKGNFAPKGSVAGAIADRI